MASEEPIKLSLGKKSHALLDPLSKRADKRIVLRLARFQPRMCDHRPWRPDRAVRAQAQSLDWRQKVEAALAEMDNELSAGTVRKPTSGWRSTTA